MSETKRENTLSLFYFADENNVAAGLVRLHLSHYCTGGDSWAEGKFTHMCLIFTLKMTILMTY